MKNKRHSKSSRAKAAARTQRPVVPVPASPLAPPPAVAPLAGEALERRVAEHMCKGFRATDARTALREACNGAEDSAIEAALVSRHVKSVVEPVSRAFAIEHSVAILQTTFCKARAALTSEKPTPAEILALKIVVGIFIERMMERIEGGLWQDSLSLLGFSDHEKSLIENLIQLERGQREPVAEDPQPVPEICASAENGE